MEMSFVWKGYKRQVVRMAWNSFNLILSEVKAQLFVVLFKHLDVLNFVRMELRSFECSMQGCFFNIQKRDALLTESCGWLPKWSSTVSMVWVVSTVGCGGFLGVVVLPVSKNFACHFLMVSTFGGALLNLVLYFLWTVVAERVVLKCVTQKARCSPEYSIAVCSKNRQLL